MCSIPTGYLGRVWGAFSWQKLKHLLTTLSIHPSSDRPHAMVGFRVNIVGGLCLVVVNNYGKTE